MEIREATDSDIPLIIELLKLSLGESLMPKTEAYWRWKHIENPFGLSPVFLCFENDVLIGVRAFMQWRWQTRAQVYKALRAVDTATHPQHQGKGIFKRLTLSLLETCKQNGYHFVFNTPNLQSKPGYLKMGWIEAGTLPIRMEIQRPVKMLSQRLFSKTYTVTGTSLIEYFLHHPKLTDLLIENDKHGDTIVTKASVPYLKWRYLSVPVTKYIAVGDEEGTELNGLIIGRIKDTRWGREMRVTDFFFNERLRKKELMKKFEQLKKEWRTDYTTFSGTIQTTKLVSNFQVPIGPTVTVRSLNLTELDDFKNFTNWSPSLGDLELF